MKQFLLFLLVLIFTYSPSHAFSGEPLSLSSTYKDCNVILIIVDALRPDRLGCYGYTKKTSPNIDALARQGIVFRNAFSQIPTTLPSTVSIYTSLYPSSHGVKYIFKDKLPPQVYTLAEILDIYGYRTVWFGLMADPHSGSHPNVLKGFQEKSQLNFEDVFHWVRKHSKEPFFMTIHSYQVHDFFFPFSRFHNKFTLSMPKAMLTILDTIEKNNRERLQEELRSNPENIYKILGKEWVEAHKEDLMQPFSRKSITRIFDSTEDKQSLNKFIIFWVDRYFDYIRGFDKKQLSDFLLLLDGSVFDLDTKVGVLMENLRELNIDDKTIIIITADHGNEFYEHGKVGHRGAYDESIRIPLIFYIPGFAKNKNVNTGSVQEFAQSIDIFPTILDLVNIPIPAQAQGISLVGLMEGKRGVLQNKYVFSQTIGDLLSIRSKHWKLILNQESLYRGIGPEAKLFYLKKDKYEKNNLIRIRPGVAEAMRKDLNSKLSSLTLYQNENSAFTPGLSEETKERIIKTGYW